MLSHSFTFRRKWFNAAVENDKGTPYGDHVEKVASGPNKGQEVPCFLIETNVIPENWNELLEQLKGDKNFIKFMKWSFETAILEEVRKYFNKLKTSNPTAEQTEQGRADVIARCKEIGSRFTLASLFTEALSATAVVDTFNSPEMQELAKRAQAGDIEAAMEFARRSTEILASVK